MLPWKIKRLDTSEVYTFLCLPNRFPDFAYEQAMTRHKLLDGTVKMDRDASLLKTITFTFPFLITRAEREKIEDWAALACKMQVTWYDEDDHTHVDTGYMVLESSRGIDVGLIMKYNLVFSLIITEEA